MKHLSIYGDRTFKDALHVDSKISFFFQKMDIELVDSQPSICCRSRLKEEGRRSKDLEKNVLVEITLNQVKTNNANLPILNGNYDSLTMILHQNSRPNTTFILRSLNIVRHCCKPSHFKQLVLFRPTYYIYIR